MLTVALQGRWPFAAFDPEGGLRGAPATQPSPPNSWAYDGVPGEGSIPAPLPPPLTLFSSVSDCSNRQQKTTSSAIKAVAASSAMLPLITAQTVAFDRGFGGRISRGGTHARPAQGASLNFGDGVVGQAAAVMG